MSEDCFDRVHITQESVQEVLSLQRSVAFSSADAKRVLLKVSKFNVTLEDHRKSTVGMSFQDLPHALAIPPSFTSINQRRRKF